MDSYALRQVRKTLKEQTSQDPPQALLSADIAGISASGLSVIDETNDQPREEIGIASSTKRDTSFSDTPPPGSKPPTLKPGSYSHPTASGNGVGTDEAILKERLSTSSSPHSVVDLEEEESNAWRDRSSLSQIDPAVLQEVQSSNDIDTALLEEQQAATAARADRGMVLLKTILALNDEGAISNYVIKKFQFTSDSSIELLPFINNFIEDLEEAVKQISDQSENTDELRRRMECLIKGAIQNSLKISSEEEVHELLRGQGTSYRRDTDAVTKYFGELRPSGLQKQIVPVENQLKKIYYTFLRQEPEEMKEVDIQNIINNYFEENKLKEKLICANLLQKRCSDAVTQGKGGWIPWDAANVPFDTENVSRLNRLITTLQAQQKKLTDDRIQTKKAQFEEIFSEVDEQRIQDKVNLLSAQDLHDFSVFFKNKLTTLEIYDNAIDKRMQSIVTASVNRYYELTQKREISIQIDRKSSTKGSKLLKQQCACETLGILDELRRVILSLNGLRGRENQIRNAKTPKKPMLPEAMLFSDFDSFLKTREEAVSLQCYTVFQSYFNNLVDEEITQEGKSAYVPTLQFLRAAIEQATSPILQSQNSCSQFANFLMTMMGGASATPENEVFNKNLAERTETINQALSDLNKLTELKKTHPEQNHSLDVLDKISEADPTLVITNEHTDRKKLSAPWRLYQWWNRSKTEKKIFRKGIVAARDNVLTKYGPTAVTRFDSYFALRYRKGSPLTVGALNRFLANEKKLQSVQDELEDTQQNISVVQLELDDNVTAIDHQDRILACATAEFEKRYYIRNESNDTLSRPENMSAEDQSILFAEFYSKYLQRSIVIKETPPKISKAANGFRGFFSSRFNAMWTSIFSGSNNRANEELKTKIIEWLKKQGNFAANSALEKEITRLIDNKLETNGRLTIEDLDALIVKAAIVTKENTTLLNALFYGLWKPVVGTIANTVAAAAGAKIAVTSSSVGTGAAKAAALAGALYMAGEDKPGVRLGIALTTLWAADNPKLIGAAEHSLVSNVTNYATSAAKYAALIGGAHIFPPLLLALPFV